MTCIIQDRYELLEWMQEGGESIIYRGHDRQANQPVVLKRSRYAIPLASHDEWLSEVMLLKNLRHPSILPLQDCFIHTIEMVDYGMLVYPFIEGQTLEEESLHTRYTQDEVKAITIELLEIVTHLQRLSPPILHRDIKPSNIMRDRRTNRLMLLDFGLATDFFPTDVGQTVGVGTVGYQAPEQIAGYPCLSSDVYAIGAVAVELLSKRKARHLLVGQMLDWSALKHTLSQEWITWLSDVITTSDKRIPNAQAAQDALQHPKHTEHHPHQRPSNQSNKSQSMPVVMNTLARVKRESSHTNEDTIRQRLRWLYISVLFLGLLPIPFIIFYRHKRPKYTHKA